MGLKERSEKRKKNIVWHIAKDFNDAKKWDLKFWLSKTPQMRIYALECLRKELKTILHAKKNRCHRGL